MLKHTFHPAVYAASGCSTSQHAFRAALAVKVIQMGHHPDGRSARGAREKQDGEADGKIETAHPSNLGSQDIFNVGTLKDVGRS